MSESWDAEKAFDLAIWLAGVGHFVVLLAGSQVPGRLNWKSELKALSPFNRKLLWTYWAFTGLTIAGLGVLTLVLHDEMLAGERAAIAVAAFAGVYWICRIAVDFFYFSHRDWPAGGRFLLGHILLTATFVFLAGTYVGLLLWHLW